MVNMTSQYDSKVQKLLEECKISAKLLNYIENFNYPYVNDVQMFYEQLLKIGQGTFGEVFKARCKRTGQLVALKKILMENEKEGFPITALREIKMLKLLKHPNITELIEVCTCKQRNARERFSFYLVFTFCEHDLAGLLSTKAVQNFSLVEIKTMAKHILEGLNKIHKSNILHRDMKSANVLITSDGILKLADFGLARLMIKQQDYRYTNRVVTLWYRPPELLLGSSNYGPSIDIWGAGCIIAELWIRTPILQGNTEQEQLQRISKLCGSLNPQNWPGIEQLPLYGKLTQNGVNNALPQTYPRRVRERIGPFLTKWANSQEDKDDRGLDQFLHYLAFMTQQNELALLLIDEMLALSPERRLTAEGALDHNFFWDAPLPAENIKELVDKLKGTNLFEYTSGCGAHANRKRPAPAVQGHTGPHQKQQRGTTEHNRASQQQSNPQKQSQQPQHQISTGRVAAPPQSSSNTRATGAWPPPSSQQHQEYSGSQQRCSTEKDRQSQTQTHKQISWHQQHSNPIANSGRGPQPLLSTGVHPWQQQPPSQYLQSGIRMRVPPPPSGQQINRFPQTQPNYTRQPPPDQQQPTRFFNNARY